MEKDDYRDRFKLVFNGDFRFSRIFRKDVDSILLQNLTKIKDHEFRKTEHDQQKDSDGADRTVFFPEISVGVRVRRDKPRYIKYADFTVDLKEWRKEKQPNYYFYGYGNSEKRLLRFYALFDYKRFLRKVAEGQIPKSLQKNWEHSLVYFYAFPLKRIFETGCMIDFGGEPELIRQLLGDDAISPKLADFIGV